MKLIKYFTLSAEIPIYNTREEFVSVLNTGLVVKGNNGEEEHTGKFITSCGAFTGYCSQIQRTWMGNVVITLKKTNHQRLN